MRKLRRSVRRFLQMTEEKMRILQRIFLCVILRKPFVEKVNGEGYFSPLPLINLVILTGTLWPTRKKYKFVDLGSGDGTILEFLHLFGFRNLLGIEISHYLVGNARGRALRRDLSIDYKCSDIQKVKLEKSSLPFCFIFFNSFSNKILKNWLDENKKIFPPGTILVSLNEQNLDHMRFQVLSHRREMWILGRFLSVFKINSMKVYSLNP